MFKNISSLPVDVNNPKNDSIKETMITHNIDIMGLCKTNITWHKAPGHMQMGERTAEWFEACHVSVVWNQTDPLTMVNQFGGVALISTNKIVYHINLQGLTHGDLGAGRGPFTRKKWPTHLCGHLLLAIPNEKGPLSVYNQQQ